MDPNIIIIFLTIVILAVSGYISFIFAEKRSFQSIKQYEEKANEIKSKAKKEADLVNVQVAERVSNFKERIKEDDERLKEKIKRVEDLISIKKEQLLKKEAREQVLKDMINEENKKIEDLKKDEEKIKENSKLKLSEKVGLSMVQAKDLILEDLNQDLELMKKERLQRYEQHLEDEKIRIAKNIIIGAIQRYSSPTSVEKKSLVISLPKDELKAKIIGKDASTLIFLEEITECDIIFNDTPNTIIISSFDLVKKHIGRETIIKLLKENHITEEVIKRKIEEVKSEMEVLLINIGKDMIKKMNLKGRNFPDEFYKIVGRLQFRTSYGQNIIKHSTEVGTFTIMLGSEIGVNLETAKIGGFLHDLGKAIDHDVGDPHDQLTKEIMEKYGFSDEEIHAAWTHHDSVPIETAEALLVKAGDAVSAGRPGARQETLEKYLERINSLEEIGNSYEGVTKAFAISAGRELRINVDPKVLNDDDLQELADTVADEIEENVSYPGKIKVNVIRRMQSIDYVKK